MLRMLRLIQLLMLAHAVSAQAAQAPVMSLWAGKYSTPEPVLRQLCDGDFPDTAPHALLELQVSDQIASARCSKAYRKPSGGCIGCGPYFRPKKLVLRSLVCPAGFALSGNTCLGQCPNGKLEDPATNSCQDSGRCPPGQEKQNGACKPEANNPVGAIPSQARATGDTSPLPMSDNDPGLDGGEPECGDREGNPCNAVLGNKFQVEVDIAGYGTSPLKFVRYYNSYNLSPGQLGEKWRHSYERRIISGTGPIAYADMIRDDGAVWRHVLAKGRWQGPSGNRALLSVVGSAWRYMDADNNIETYDAQGYLARIDFSAGGFHIVDWYVQGSTKVITKVADQDGRTLLFEYDTQNRLAAVIDPDAHRHSFEYDAQGRLVAVHRPGNNTRRYEYDASGSNASIFTGLLTGLTDERGALVSSWKYDVNGQVISSHTGSNGAIEFKRNPATMTQMLGALRTEIASRTQLPDGSQRIRSTTAIAGKFRTGVISTKVILPDGNSELVSTYREFNSSGLPILEYRPDGSQHAYAYDDQNRLSSHSWVIGVNSKGLRIWNYLSYRWSDDHNQPISIDEPAADGKRIVTTFEYDASGRLIKKTRKPGNAAASTWEYHRDAVGRIVEQRGPIAGVVRQWQYDSQGQLIATTDPAGRLTTYGKHDHTGRPQVITGPDGIQAMLSYNWRGQTTTIQRGGDNTRFDFDDAGHLRAINHPDGSTASYQQDEAGKLIEYRDRAGRIYHYTYDTNGQPAGEEILDAYGNIVLKRSETRDILGRIQHVRTGDDESRQTTYTWQGLNRLRTTLPLNRIYQYAYDTVGNLIQAIDSENGARHPSNYEYAPKSFLSRSIPASNGGGYSSYVPSPEGNVLTETGADTGKLEVTYDLEGRIVSRKDARNKEMRFSYDATGNPVSLILPEQTYTYAYDTGGRLARSSDAAGSRDIAYDQQGHPASITRTIDGQRYTLGMGWLSGDLLGMLIYPSGRQVRTTYRGGEAVGLDIDGQPFITDSRYSLPGMLAAIRWAAGGESTWERDTAGQVVRHGPPWAAATTLTYDAGGRLAEQTQSGQTWRYAYDRLDRLSKQTLPNGNIWHYTYDPAGNRTRRQGVAGDDTYAYALATSRLSNLQRSAAPGRTYTYDAAGLPLSDGRLNFEHDSRGLLSSVTHPNGTTRYRHDAAGRRLAKTEGGQARHFIHATDGRLLAEHDPATGEAMAEYLWLGDWLVGVIRGGVAYRIHADHLGTPRSIADAAGQEQWRWQPDEAFGDNPPEDKLTGKPFDFPLRHPGQYADAETGLFHNGVRSYDPSTGRYLQPDPIGTVRYRNLASTRLMAQIGPEVSGDVDVEKGPEGNQVYSYVGGNPLSRIDPSGLQAVLPIPMPPPPAMSPYKPKQPGDPGFDPWRDTIPETRPPEPLPPMEPRPPGSGCRALFEACLTGTKSICGPAVSYGVCTALYFACVVVQGGGGGAP